MDFTGNTIPLWNPQHADQTPIAVYRQHVNKKFGKSLRDSHDLHRWSVESKHDFWIDLWQYVGMVPELPPGITKAFDDSKTIRDVPQFFPGITMNYAENVLSNRDPNALALVGLREGEPLDGKKWTWGELREQVRKIRSALLRSGIKKDDRVGALMSNCPETIAIFLATASIGAIFTSISPEMGLEGCVSRLQQVEPSILFAESHQTYKGKKRPMKDKILKIYEALKPRPQVVIVPLGPIEHPFSSFSSFLQKASSTDALEYLRVSFNESLMILYSSGTSGPPKCIVHRHGAIIQLKKIAILHNSLGPEDIVFQYSSTSWVLWNIMNGHLSVGAALVCYDGSPLYPDPSTKLRIIQHHRATYFGTSPRYLLELEMSAIRPSDFDLSSVRMVTTTGAMLTTDQFRWFYKSFPKNIHLSSIAGGTEICTSWIASDPAGPVYAGEMQMIALGHDVDVGHPETGESIKSTGEQGELICRSPFPSMPIRFWGDVDNAKYNEAYFERYDNIVVWAQHDWVQFNPRTNGSQIHGRRSVSLNATRKFHRADEK
jgi:acetoacetyl-CoA synthetase